MVPLLVAGLLLLVVLAPRQVVAAVLTPQEERGRQIYNIGTSPAGRPITAYFGKDLLEVPGESATCFSCHGYDGLGRIESGVIPSNITWQHLMKSYGHIHPNGVEHSAFSEPSLISYMRDGVFPGGRQGDPTMPVYDIATEDLLDLIAYNKRLGNPVDPGLSASVIRIGTIIPAQGGGVELGNVLQQTVQAYFADVNSRGGVYGRSLELVVLKVGRERDAVAKVRTELATSGLFALVNTLTPGLEPAIDALVEELALPLVAPYTQLPAADEEQRRYRFHLLASLREQGQILALAAKNNAPSADPLTVVFAPTKGALADAGAVAASLLQEKGWHKVLRREYTPGSLVAEQVARQLQAEGVALVLFFGDETDAVSLLRATGALPTPPLVFMPGPHLGKGLYDVPLTYKDRLWLTFPSLPEDRTSWGLADFEAMVNRRQLPVEQVSAQLTAYAAAKLLVEGLRRAGRDLSRERLVESLEGMFEYATGLTPLISYGKNRRNGTLGAHLVTVDPTRPGTKDHITPRGWLILK